MTHQLYFGEILPRCGPFRHLPQTIHDLPSLRSPPEKIIFPCPSSLKHFLYAPTLRMAKINVPPILLMSIVTDSSVCCGSKQESLRTELLGLFSIANMCSSQLILNPLPMSTVKFLYTPPSPHPNFFT
jgi:hypothetical protein